MFPPGSWRLFSPEAQHRALLEVAEAISQHRDLRELFHELAARLHGVVEFDYLNLTLLTRRATSCGCTSSKPKDPARFVLGQNFRWVKRRPDGCGKHSSRSF